MAKSTIAKLLVASRSVVLFHPVETAVVGSCSRFFNTKSCRENDCEYNYNLKIRGGSTYDVRDLFNDAFCHRLSATRNLTRLLNLMDERIRDRVCTSPCGYPRWDVTQDAKAFYLVRDMFGLPNQDVNESVEIDYLGSWHVFGCVRVYFGGNMIKIIVGKNGPDPGAAYEGYVIRIYFGSRFCKSQDVEMDVQNEVLKITIPKKEGKWLHTITTQIKFFSPE